ncbi:putative baseplate assembly protein [Tunturiibacter lichenicola]|uniref:putative baseplate assembly protein n=1 Tax=Tunturiibacter lichenicola TaxID=2051959 RepID=UPI003D9BCD9D
MPLLLPNLDDRRWSDLVDEGRALIPLYGSEWTDQNASDPGITLIELLASVTEMDIFEVNRISDRARLKFLSLVGVSPQPPLAASMPLRFSLPAGSPSMPLAAGAIFSGTDVSGTVTPFKTSRPLTIAPGSLQAVQVLDAGGFQDQTSNCLRGLPVGIFGSAAAVGTELYLGFDQPLAAAQSLTLYFQLNGSRSGAEERGSILAAAEARASACAPVTLPCLCKSASQSVPTMPEPGPITFTGVRLTWEILTASGWASLTGAVSDDTASFTLTGTVVITPSVAGLPGIVGKVKMPLSYLRVRLDAGAYDAPPVVTTVLANTILAYQTTPVGNTTFVIAAGVVASPPTPPGDVAGIHVRLGGQGQVIALQFVETGPQLRILAFTPATPTGAGSIVLECAAIGTSNGTPDYTITLPQAPIVALSLIVFSIENGEQYGWVSRPDFDASGRADRHFTLDATAGTITFGNGEHGLAAPLGATFYAAWEGTAAEAGNVRAALRWTLLDSPHNRCLLPNYNELAANVTADNPVAASGGAGAESLDLAIVRATTIFEEPQRAVTLDDYEQFALETPGRNVARVKGWANHHPSFPCFSAPGQVTLVILPYLPIRRPVPSAELLQAVANYVNSRRIIGSRLKVVAPTYIEVAVQATIVALAGSSLAGVQQRVTDMINQFLDPLTGGLGGTGWPFGRDVYRAEIMQVIGGVAGVDYIATLALEVNGCQCDPQCGNVCVAPTWLVAAGQHTIEVTR